MKIGELQSSMYKMPQLEKFEPETLKPKFGEMVTEFIKGVNDQQFESKEMLTKFIEGEDVELHDVMIAGQKAKTSLELLMEIRNQSVSAFRELTKMQ